VGGDGAQLSSTSENKAVINPRGIRLLSWEDVTDQRGGVVSPAPERTRLFRLFKTHHDWTQVFLAAPTVLGVIDTYGIELIHPMREGRSPQQIGRKASPIIAGLSAANSVSC